MDKSLFAKHLEIAVEFVAGDENRIEDAVLRVTRDIQPLSDRKKMRRLFPSIILSGIIKGRKMLEEASAQKRILDEFQRGDTTWPSERRKSVVLEASAYSDSRHYRKRVRSDG